MAKPRLICKNCGASAADTSKERGRFRRRHPLFCKVSMERHVFSKQLAQGTRSVEPTTWAEHKELMEEANG